VLVRPVQIRSYDDPIWQLAKTSNVDSIRHEFERSQASPLMVDPDGRSLLWVGTASRRLQSIVELAFWRVNNAFRMIKPHHPHEVPLLNTS
jgi:hypothetical protein